MVALLTINLVWFLFAMFILMCQGWLPLNPDGNPSMSPHLAFNTAISFLVNCNLQHYSGESGVSYLLQLLYEIPDQDFITSFGRGRNYFSIERDAHDLQRERYHNFHARRYGAG